MLKKYVMKEDGFTLIEVIVTLLLVSILAAMGGSGIVMGIEGYLFARTNTELSQKSQLALARMTLELGHLSTLDSSSTDDSIVFTTSPDNKTIILNLKGSTIELDEDGDGVGDVLSDSVHGTDGFFVEYIDTDGNAQTPSSFADPKDLARIDLRIRLSHSDVPSGYLEFSTSVVPRNTGTKNSPTG
jgi:prepilin-type N-terminal cleavage/methylation domain-containing protein